MEWLILLGILLFFVFVVVAKQGGQSTEFSYERIDTLFSPAERSFLGVLTQAVEEKGVVFGKVRVADVLRPAKGLSRSRWQVAFNRISAKHFDYVVCASDTLEVMFVVELDDKSHTKGKRVDRDHFLDSACSIAQLPLHRFKAAASYNVVDVRNTLFPPPVELNPAESIAPASSPSPEIDALPVSTEPLCPKCSSPLVKRIAQKGANKGAEFMACSGFPKCRYIDSGKPSESALGA